MTENVVALVVPADGSPARLQSIRADLAGLRAAIGGGWLEAVGGTGWHAYLDEEGRIKGLPFNEAATVLLSELGRGVGDVVGDVVFLGNAGSGEDLNADEGNVPDDLLKVADLLMLLVCPRCGGDVPQPVRSALFALSRKDNATRVCSKCGTEEAVLSFGGKDPWPNFPYRRPE